MSSDCSKPTCVKHTRINVDGTPCIPVIKKTPVGFKPPTLDFKIIYLDKICALDTTIEISYTLNERRFTYDAVAVYNTDISIWKQIFQIEINSTNFNNPVTKDVKFYINSAPLNDFNDMITNKPIGENAFVKNETAIAHNTPGSIVYNQSIDNDYVRYLAKSLFNTHLATKLFLNNDELINSVDNAVKSSWNEMFVLLQNISTTGTNANLLGTTGSKYFTNNIISIDNVCRELYLQIVKCHPERFKKMHNSTSPQALPFIVGDTVCVRITVNPAPTQDTFGGDPIRPRRYLIKFLLS